MYVCGMRHNAIAKELDTTIEKVNYTIISFKRKVFNKLPFYLSSEEMKYVTSGQYLN